jgi:hypothetical protein
MIDQKQLQQQLKQMRDNYIETMKKLISIEEEIEQTVFYIQGLEKSEREEVFSVYESYLNNLNVLRQEMTSLMNDNLVTIQSFWSGINDAHQSTTKKILSESYQNFINILFKCYNPFSWFKVDNDEEKK